MSRIIKSNRVNLEAPRIIKSQIEPQCDISCSLDMDYDQPDTKEIKTTTLIELQKRKIEQEIERLSKEKESLSIEIEKMKNDAKIEAENILQNAYNEQESIISMANDKAENIKEQSKESGYNEGYENGIVECKNSYEQIINEALSIRQDALKYKKDIASSSEQDLIKLMISCVEKIIHIKMDEDDSLILGILREGLEKFTFTESLTIRVNEADFEVINSSKSKILCFVENIDTLDIKVDNSLSKGSLIIDTSSGSINPSIQNQIDVLKDEFLNLLIAGEV